jgi:hypothetical protein
MLVSIITLIVCWPYAAFAGTITGAFYRQTIQYVNSEDKTANDLRLRFNQETTKMPGVTAAKITTRATPRQSNEGIPINEATVEFAQNTFGTVTSKSKVDIDLGPKDPTLKAPKILMTSEWTEDGEIVSNGQTTIIGKPMRIKPDPPGDPGTVEFFSDDNLQIMYSNIQVYVNNNLANFNIDNFLTPTGSLVTGVPISTPIDTIVIYSI